MISRKLNQCQEATEDCIHYINQLVHHRGIRSVEDLDNAEYLILTASLNRNTDIRNMFNKEKEIDNLLDNLIKICHYSQYQSIEIFKKETTHEF